VLQGEGFDIEFPRIGGDYTRQVPVEAFVLAEPGDLVGAAVVTLDGGLLATGPVTVGGGDAARCTKWRRSS
jgi:hypothetical protein